jgi:hypothetical protein
MLKTWRLVSLVPLMSTFSSLLMLNHVKAGHWRTILHLKTTCTPFNINKEENVLISGTREKSAVADSTEPKQ